MGVVIIILIILFCPLIILVPACLYFFIPILLIGVFYYIRTSINDNINNTNGEITAEQSQKICNYYGKKFPEVFDTCGGKYIYYWRPSFQNDESVEVITNKETTVYVGKSLSGEDAKPENVKEGTHFVLSGSKEFDFEKSERKYGCYYGMAMSNSVLVLDRTYTYVNLADVDRVEKIKKEKKLSK